MLLFTIVISKLRDVELERSNKMVTQMVVMLFLSGPLEATI